MLKLAMPFRDHMVLQRHKPVAVFGSAEPGQTVRVTVQNKTAEAAAGADGRWLVTCGPLETSFGESVTVTAGEETLSLTDVLVGEVWLAGGQSNMEFHMRYDADFPEERPVCANDAIRFFDFPEVSYPGQLEEADYGKQYGFWRKATPEDLERFSAPGYYFAKTLYEKYKVPMGILGCNWGGTPACAWMSREAVLEGGGKVWLDAYDAAVRDLDLAEYDKKFRESPMNWRTDQLGDPMSDMFMFGCSMEEIGAKLMESGADLTSLPDLMPVMGPKHERRPCGLYESMLLPLVPYGIRGVIWYQGETDGDEHPEAYATVFPALIREWRRLWGEEKLPFLFVQLAPMEHWMMSSGATYGIVREAQQHTADTVPYTGMAVTGDVGMRWDIHPKKKAPVGRRLALLAEKVAYGEDLLCEAPTLREARWTPGELTLRLDNAGEGLKLGEGEISEFLRVLRKGEAIDLSGCSARAEGDTLTLTGRALDEAPDRAELGRTAWFRVSLYNSADIPARPAAVEI